MDVPRYSARPVRRLTIGPSARSRATVVTLGVMLLCGGCFLASIVAVTGSYLTGAGGYGELNLPGIALGSLAGLGLAGFATFGIVKVFRTAFWLEGTTVVLRGAFSTRRVNLATAEVAGDAIVVTESTGHYTWRSVISSAVRARDARTGVTIRIPVRTEGRGRLPSDELAAIADAIMAGRLAESAGYTQAEVLARALHEMADTPFPV